MATTVAATEAATEILAASFRDLTEVVGTMWAGAHHVTLSLDLLEALGDHPLSEQAIEEFARFS
jgi:transaldolase